MKPALAQHTLSGFGRTHPTTCAVARPERVAALQQIAQQTNSSMIARGFGSSYGDAAINPPLTINCTRLDHFLEFDTEQGLLRAHAGVSLAEVMRICVPRGFLPPVLPGTSAVTLGGAFASNVHGKNHAWQGDFAEHVRAFTLLDESGRLKEYTPEDAIFWATAGGMGMTGIITELTLQLMPVSNARLITRRRRVQSVEGMLAAFAQAPSADYRVGWIDHLASGDALGRGVFESAWHSPIPDPDSLARFRIEPRGITIPRCTPSCLLNRATMGLYNRWYLRGAGETARERTSSFTSFFHPLDGLQEWGRLYGKRGFHQFQCVLPASPELASHVRQLLMALQQERLWSFLAVIKAHRAGYGLLTFPIEGVSLALDIAGGKDVETRLKKICALVAELGGRVYLAKDSVLDSVLFQRMYGEAGQEWLEQIRSYDPRGRFQSSMSRRLKWKTVA